MKQIKKKKKIVNLKMYKKITMKSFCVQQTQNKLQQQQQQNYFKIEIK